MNMNKEYFFKKGNKYSQGRPPGTKNQINIIRNRILRVVKRRVMHETDLETVSTTDLLKFLATIMPKDLSIAASSSQVQYISNIPRQEPEPKPLTIVLKQELTPVTESEDSTNGKSADSAIEATSEVVLRPELYQANESEPVG